MRHRPPSPALSERLPCEFFAKVGTERQVQMRDEKRQRAFGRKLMFWLTTSKHINRTGFSRMRVGLAIAVLCGPRDSAMMADVLQLLRYEG